VCGSCDRPGHVTLRTRKREEERSSHPDLAFRPYPAAAPVDDPLNICQADTGAFELYVTVKPLEDPE
jgi:hypothetical protein